MIVGMKNILLYGDSFFWGVNAETGGRHSYKNQVGTICRQYLGEEYNVVTEGLRGRAMFGENGWFPERDGLAQFGPIFASHLPLDTVVIMLGTNDLNSKTKHSANEVTNALDMYKQKMQFWCDFMKYEVPKLIIISPPAINTSDLVAFKDIFVGSAELIPGLKKSLAEYAENHDDYFMNAADIVYSNGSDGIHITAEENKKLATAIAQKIKEVV